MGVKLPSNAKEPPMDTLPSRRRLGQQPVQKVG
jgi:hypothetical protein